jgi:hypothetical protein
LASTGGMWARAVLERVKANRGRRHDDFIMDEV